MCLVFLISGCIQALRIVEPEQCGPIMAYHSDSDRNYDFS